MSEKRLELVRGLGPWASAAIVVGTMVGTGIFLKPAEMAREGRFVSIVFAAWIVGAILSIFGALAFAELGAAIPEAGGEYAYLRRGFSPSMGFSVWLDAFHRRAALFRRLHCCGNDALPQLLLAGRGRAALHRAHCYPGTHHLDSTATISFSPGRSLSRFSGCS